MKKVLHLAKLPVILASLYWVINFLQTPSPAYLTSLRKSLEHIDQMHSKSYFTSSSHPHHHKSNREEEESRVINLALVSCGCKSRFQELEVAVKSAFLAQSNTDPHVTLNFIIFTDSLSSEVQDLIESWQVLPHSKRANVTLDLRSPDYGHFASLGDITTNYGKCATLRLFFDVFLQKYDKVLYVDTDVIFLDAPSTIWKNFYLMNGTQLAAMGKDNLDPSLTIYHYYQWPTRPYGLQSGVMLMDLEKMRRAHFSNITSVTYSQMHPYILAGDQDIYNYIFNVFPEKLLVLPSNLNFYTDLCLSFNATYLETTGVLPVSILHGARGSFYENHRFDIIKHPYSVVTTALATFVKNINMVKFAWVMFFAYINDHVVYQSAFKTAKSLTISGEGYEDFSMPSQIFTNYLLAYPNSLRDADPCKKIIPHLNSSFTNLSPLLK